jgi:hypothetical protein
MSTTSKTSKLTVADLYETLNDERHLGWGYATLDVLGDSKRDRVDRAIVAVANDLGLTYEELFNWSNSKHGRWLADRVYGNDAPATQATVRKELTREIITQLMVETGHARLVATTDLIAYRERLAADYRGGTIFAKVHVGESLHTVDSELATR